jgi:serine/threonine-protein kinase RIO1
VKEAEPLLLRDLTNLQNFFAKYDVKLNAESEYRRLLKKIETVAG